MTDDAYTEVLDSTQQLMQVEGQLETLLTATDSLESLIRHLDTHPVEDDAHRSAIRVSVESLLSNTGLEVDDFIPHLEGTVSTESLKDRLKDLWKHLVNMVLTILAMIKRYWQKVSTYRGQLRMSAESLAKRASGQRMTTVKKPNIDLGMEIKAFFVGGAVLSDPDAVIRQIHNAMDQYKVVTSLYGKAMLELGRNFETLLTTGVVGPDALNKVNQLFTDELPIGLVASKVKALVYRDPRFGRRLALAAPPTVGGWTLFCLTLDSAQKEKISTDPVAYAQALRTTGLKFVLTNVNQSNITSGTVRTASGLQVQTMAKQVLAVLDLIDSQERLMGMGRLERQIKAVLKAGERYQSMAGESMTYDQSVLRFVRNYASWAMGPVDQMTTNLLTVSRNLLIYGRNSLSH